MDRLHIEHCLLKQPSYFRHIIYSFILLLISTLIGTIFFQLHIQVFNSIFGPFHLNLEQFIQHVNNFKSQQSSSRFWKIEYIQVELNENNIQQSFNTYDIIRQYSDPVTRQYSIATYKKVQYPDIYVKLPTSTQEYFHAQFPFRFHLYSIRTLKCIVKNLPSDSEMTHRSWVEKIDYVKYIKKQYDKNSTQFNRAILTKCGILIGYLYRPRNEKAFIQGKQHQFYSFDIALNITQPYYPFYKFLICGLIALWLLLKTLFYIILYLRNIIRCKILHKYGLTKISLKLSKNVQEELWLLNLDGSSHEQLLKFDEFVRQCEHRFNNQLLIIENDQNHLFVVLFQVDLQKCSTIHYESSPFIICPESDIRIIRHDEGILYGKDLSKIPWPITMTGEQNFAEWLHQELMEISSGYRQRYQQRLQNERSGQQQYVTFRNQHRLGTQRHRDVSNRSIVHSSYMARLIHEEENFQTLKLERQSIGQRIYERDSPASARFIAEFRMKHEQNKIIVDTKMANEQIQCIVCLEYLKLNEQYAPWPCPGKKKHIFHYQCMLSSLRSKNKCPLCRHEVEGVPMPTIQNLMPELFRHLVL
ncbi:unnamed protein product [Rotaria sordida]|uniref:RING-type domain-containing protein n=1 Tax=Rotaria sordida TaxID=392033 RepID=A0A814YGN2_9BILA|nr:unnamed protein product [Rotaria sordida]